MNKTTSDAAILSISLDKASATSLQAQLLDALRGLVHSGRLLSGARLPSSRNLATELAVSRVTVTAVYDQLIAEGYAEGRRGSGVFIASDLPDIPLQRSKNLAARSAQPLPANEPFKPFGLGSPDLAAFPYRDWTRIYDRLWRNPGPGLLGQPRPMGFGPLRTAIAAHLEEWRGIRCSPEQVVITSGLVESLELIAKAVFEPGDRILVEEPGHKTMLSALTGTGMICEPVRIDSSGFNLSHAGDRRLHAKAVVVTPSRHYPLGMTLPLARRLELLRWAKEQQGFILEDDYDGEFRYQGQPLPAMMSLDEVGRVIYLGSFSKVMFPALRLGYMVVPEPLLPGIADRLGQLGPRAALLAQPVLAEFIAEGMLATHIRRMRRLYSERQQLLLEALDQHVAGLLSARAETGGMHLVAVLSDELAAKVDDAEVSSIAENLGLSIKPLSSFFLGAADQQGLVMGYAAYSPEEITEGVVRLAQALRQRLKRE